jgi:ABC-type transport system involved in cytochrome bd biosynthesis fused ATPase/permease subunit
MDEVADSCSAAITFIAFFAGLFATSLIINFFMVTALVTIVFKLRKRQHVGEYSTERVKNLYTTKVSNAMWSDEAPEYGHESERSTDLEDLSTSITSQDRLKDCQRSRENSMDNPHYEETRSVKKTVRFTSV